MKFSTAWPPGVPQPSSFHEGGAANANAVPPVVVTASTEFQLVAALHMEIVYTFPGHM